MTEHDPDELPDDPADDPADDLPDDLEADPDDPDPGLLDLELTGSGVPRPAIAWQVQPALRGRVDRASLRLLARRLRRAARRVGVALADLPGVAVSVVDDAEIQRLNAEHMGKDRTTDVLSFPARPPGPEGRELAARGVPLGDIVLCWDAVERQAAARLDAGESAEALAAAALDEATVLVIHGLCHLLGHDHAARGEARAMHRRERRGLRAARVADIPRPYGLRPDRGA